jgi:hypothetical protein
VGAAAGKVCADPNSMDSGARELRKSLNYVEASTEPEKTCSVCGFFEAGKEGCGSCQIFNGSVNAGGHCDFWARKS